MNRRDFLKLTSSLGVAVTLPLDFGTGRAAPLDDGLRLSEQQPVDVGDVGAFQHDREYGRVLPIYAITGLPQAVIDATIVVLIEDAKACLPPGIMFEIRRKHPDCYGREHGMAWFYSPKLRETKAPPLGFVNEIGCFNHGRFIT